MYLPWYIPTLWEAHPSKNPCQRQECKDKNAICKWVCGISTDNSREITVSSWGLCYGGWLEVVPGTGRWLFYPEYVLKWLEDIGTISDKVAYFLGAMNVRRHERVTSLHLFAMQGGERSFETVNVAVLHWWLVVDLFAHIVPLVFAQGHMRLE